MNIQQAPEPPRRRTTVEQVLDLFEEQKKVLVERSQQHGSFDVFDRAAEHANLKPSEVVRALVGIKRARLETNPYSEDSLVDLLNYQAISTVMTVNLERAKRDEIDRRMDMLSRGKDMAKQ